MHFLVKSYQNRKIKIYVKKRKTQRIRILFFYDFFFLLAGANACILHRVATIAYIGYSASVILNMAKRTMPSGLSEGLFQEQAVMMIRH